MFADIIINRNARALNKTFDYIVPKELESSIRIGSRVFVPFGNGKKIDDGFVINFKDKSEYATKEIVRIEEKESLEENNIELAKLMARKYFCNISDCIKLMLPPGTSSKDAANRMKEKTGNFVFLKKEIGEVQAFIDEGIIKSDKQKRVLNFLIQNDGTYKTDLEALTDVSPAIIKTLEKNGYIEIREGRVERNPFFNKKIKRDSRKKLTEEQQVCFDGINKSLNENVYEKSLIYGITGSGKTEIYLQLIEEVLNKGKTAIVLVPEISLTPQMVDRFLARFGETIAVLHSKLSNGERYDEWQKIKRGEKKIVIGARSAIFAPVKKLGIIIIDEEHDLSYKSDTTPRYNAKDLAKYIAEKNNAPLVLGSATPEMSTMYDAKQKKINLYVLSKRANKMNLPEVEIVDLRNELASRK